MSKSLENRTIVITRPPGQANRLQGLITEHGGNPVLFPLIAISPLSDYHAFEEKLDVLHRYDYAIFISSNAVQHAMPRMLTRLGSIPQGLAFAAIGPVTANELATFGVQTTLTPQDRFDSEALLNLPEFQHVEAKKIMIFRGIGGREILAETLKSRGAIVDFAECYRRINPQLNLDELERLWQNKQLHAIVVSSSEALRHLVDLAGQATWLRDTVICVNHARIAEQALSAGLIVQIANAPGDPAMLDCLINTLN